MIRLAQDGEAMLAKTIVDAAYGHYVARIGGLPGPMRDDYAARVAAGELYFCGDSPQRPPQGLLVLIDAPDHLLLDNIAVLPAAQGTGVGRALLAFVDAEAARRGYTELRLYTHEKMHENIALYARLGWEETSRATQNGLARVFFRKTVSVQGLPSRV